MNNKFLVRMLAGTLVTVMAVTGVSVTANAMVSECLHPHLDRVEIFAGAECANSEYHWADYIVRYQCDSCDYYKNEPMVLDRYEEHNLIGYVGGRFICVDCGYTE